MAPSLLIGQSFHSLLHKTPQSFNNCHLFQAPGLGLGEHYSDASMQKVE